MPPEHSPKPTSVQPVVVRAALVARLHTSLAYTAFVTALAVACLCHYKKVVKNGVAGYPEEWFPSVSATIGDWYPERNLFQILIALTAGPRFALVCFQYYLHYTRRPAISTLVFVFGIIRTLSCGGIAVSTAFFVSIIPLVYFFIQHKVHRIPGGTTFIKFSQLDAQFQAAYTHYSFFEWGLIFFDVLYDALAEHEYREADLQVTLGPKTPAPEGVPAKMNSPSPVATVTTANGDALEKKSDPNSAEDLAVKRTRLSFPLISPDLRPAASFISDVYLSYIFWSIFTSLIPTLFYFSVWELGIAGHELALLSTLSPFLLGITPLLRWAASREGRTILYLVGILLGLGAVGLQSPALRLLSVAPATVVVVLGQVAKWSSSEGGDGLTLGLGLLVASLSKHLNHSNNPVWPFVNGKDTIYNAIGLTLALVAVYESHTRPIAPTATKLTKEGQAPFSNHVNWISVALPLGSLLFSLHNMLSDPSTLVAWSWTGYHDRSPKGPVPHLHGSLTLIAQCAGLLIPMLLNPSHATELLTHPVWFMFGALSACIMYTYRNWTGYTGGLGFALFLMSAVPGVLQNAVQATRARGNVARVFGAAMGVYCVLNLASIFTVAYAFVSGGVVFRERTDAVLFAQMACLALSFRWPRINSLQPLQADKVPSKTTLSLSKSLLAVVSVLSVLGTLYRWPGAPPTPSQPGPRIFNAGIWTVHFGIDNGGRDSQQGITDLIRDMQLDVVGLLETDLYRTAFGHRDLTRVAVEELGYYVDIGPGPNSHTWGATLLSKFPIINSTHHLLPSPHGELAPAIEAVLDIFGTEVTVVVAHNGQEEDPLDRELQSTELARIMAASHPRPVVFLGYVVTKPRADRPAPYKILVEDGKVFDIDQDDEERWCEYILYRGLYRTSYARLSRGTLTDTELQLGQFALPKHGTRVTNETQVARYLRIPKETLPEHHVCAFTPCLSIG
ncbi:hypothetical protein C0991_010677 [Blastosporella zonata]|nr:hypothetical protein C0991_010677 [Blastosporella zonata]